jgi:hypothetical protein
MDGRAFRLIVWLQSENQSTYLPILIYVHPTDNHTNYPWIYQSVYASLMAILLDMPMTFFKHIYSSLSLRCHRLKLFRLTIRAP